MERLPKFMERPDLLILYLFGLLIVVVLVLAALFAFAPRLGPTGLPAPSKHSFPF
jgi:hypothetical protein